MSIILESFMSHSYAGDQLEINAPRTIWVLTLQLLYSIIAMLPIYYYLREVVQFNDESQYVLLLLPVTIAFLLFFIQVKFNSYFWFNEKIFNKRDIFTSAMKSALLVVVLFYFFYLIIFGYWFTGTEEYSGLGLTNKVGKAVTESLVSVSIVGFIVLVMDRIRTARMEM